MAFNIKFFYNICLPIIIGAIIYLLLRDKNFVFFIILEKFGIDKFFLPLRAFLFNNINYLPDFIRYSLPDGLYIFALTNGIYAHNISRNFAFFISITIYFLLVLSELFQTINLDLGTYDIIDILFYTLGFIFALILNSYPQRLKP